MLNRTFKLKIKIQAKKELEIVTLYDPNENEKATIKDRLWEKTSEVMDNIKNNIIIFEDLNERVGIKDNEFVLLIKTSTKKYNFWGFK